MRYIKQLVSLVLVSLVVACSSSGFHLKGQGGPDGLSMAGRKVALQGDPANADFNQQVKTALQARGATLTELAEADVIVTLSTLAETRRVSGYSSTRAVSGFRYNTEAPFILKLKGVDAEHPDSVAQAQSQTYDSNYVLGTQEEADQIKANLRREVARLLALKVAAFKAQ